MDPLERIAAARARVDAHESSIGAFLPEDRRWQRLDREARALGGRGADRGARPPLFGLLFGVKDIFHVDGFPTRAGSRLPPAVLAGPQAESVSRLLAAGALMVGKTVTTEFAYFTPGPTRNPHNLEHTPGGSSSGSAAAVAAGFCDLALGTQTIGSIIRPAAFCGIVGLKPTFGRISTRGVIPCAPSFDCVGVLAADLETVARAARVLYTTWADAPAAAPEGPTNPRRPFTDGLAVFGIPDGPYLERASVETLAWFDDVCCAVAEAGYEIRRVPAMTGFDRIYERHQVILAAEAARVHASWFREYEALYGEKMTALVRRGQTVTDDELAAARDEQQAFRASMQQSMVDARIDAWLCPSTTGPAPRGLESTGDPVMNLPWTQAGLPAIGLPAGTHASGLPMGLQVVGRWNQDETLLARAGALHDVLRRLRSRPQ